VFTKPEKERETKRKREIDREREREREREKERERERERERGFAEGWFKFGSRVRGVTWNPLKSFVEQAEKRD
jgi:hypothetical protein